MGNGSICNWQRGIQQEEAQRKFFLLEIVNLACVVEDVEIRHKINWP